MDHPLTIHRQFSDIMKKDFGGRLDHLLLCHSGPCDNLGVISAKLPEYDNSFRINVRAAMHLVSMAVPFLKLNCERKDHKGSSITILSSNAGTMPDPYSAIKST